MLTQSDLHPELDPNNSWLTILCFAALAGAIMMNLRFHLTWHKFDVSRKNAPHNAPQPCHLLTLHGQTDHLFTKAYQGKAPCQDYSKPITLLQIEQAKSRSEGGGVSVVVVLVLRLQRVRGSSHT